MWIKFLVTYRAAYIKIFEIKMLPANSTYFEKASTAMATYLFPFLLFFSGPKTSEWILKKSFGSTGIG